MRMRDRLCHLLLDGGMAALFAAYLSSAAFTYLQLETVFWQVLAIALLAAVAFSLLFYNGKTTGITLAAAALITLGAYLFLPGAQAYLAGFFGQLGTFMAFVLGGVSRLEAGDTFTFVCIATALLTLPVWLLQYKFKKVWYLPLFILAVVTVFFFALHERAQLPPLWPLLIALCYQFIRAGGEARDYASPQKSLKLRLAALLTAVAVSGLGLFFLPGDTSAWRSQGFRDLVANVNDLLNTYGNFTEPRTSFSMAQMGFQPLEHRLGGPISPSDDDVMVVNATREVYLRGNVLDHYTGQAWEHAAPANRIRLSQYWNKQEQSDVFGLALPDYTLLNRFPSSRSIDTVNIEVRTTSSGPSTLFAPSRLISLDPADRSEVVPYFNTVSEVFATKDVPYGTEYAMKGYEITRSNPYFDEFMAYVYDEKGDQLAPMDPELEQYYLQLPDNLPTTVYLHAQEAIGYQENTLNPYEKAQALERYLQENFTYALDVPYPPEDEDFVSFFLEDGRGYCTYFASAMTLMARSLGLPARYVEGFALPRAESIQDYAVTNRNAHAWTEVYFDSVGWVTFDPTPPDWASFVEDLLPQTGEAFTLPDQYGDGNYVPIEIEDTGKLEQDEEDMTLPLMIAAAALVLALGLYMGYCYLRTRRNFIRRRAKGWDAAFIAGYQDLQRLLRILGLEREKGESDLKQASRADARLLLEDVKVTDAALTATRLLLSPYACDEQDFESMMDVRDALAAYLIHARGRWYYLLHRILGLPLPGALRRRRSRRHGA